MAFAQECSDDEEADSPIGPWQDELYGHLLCGPISIWVHADLDLDVFCGTSQGDRMTKKHIATCHCDMNRWFSI
jgi:hypothetical protein